MNKNLTVSPSPHIHGSFTTRRLMLDVIIALLPAWLVGLYFLGPEVLWVTLVSIFTCVAVEYLVARFILRTPRTIGDLSAAVTGLLLAMNLPSSIPLWIVVIGAVLAIAVGKMSFGGLGNNLFNPALFARCFLLISFPVQMTTWPAVGNAWGGGPDGVTGATLLSYLKAAIHGGPSVDSLGDAVPDTVDMLVGHMGGSLGEISSIALLIGFAYLLIRRVISWHIPISIFAGVVLLSGAMWLSNGAIYASPVVHLFSGGIMLGSIFMATDYVTSPMSTRGMLLYGLMIGLLTMVIRLWGAYPEGISFAILIMNAFVPLINQYVKPTRFGKVRRVK